MQITMQSANEPCRRLIGAGCLPERAGQPTQIVLHMDLDRLRGLPGAPEADAALTVTSPHGDKTLHSHGPPSQAA
jgi:hypothetical protein